MYYFTGIQHLADGSEAVFPALGYESKDAYLAKYHQEMSYAMSNENLKGLSVLVFDSNAVIVLQDHWMRAKAPETISTNEANE